MDVAVRAATAGSDGGRATTTRRPRLGVVKFASCDGCQLTILDVEDHLLEIAERFDIVEFAEATSRRSSGPFDVLLVEGSISTPEQAVEIARLRAEAKSLVVIGACATAGGIQALRTATEHEAFRAVVQDELSKPAPAPGPLPFQQLDEILLVMAWFRRHPEASGLVALAVTDVELPLA